MRYYFTAPERMLESLEQYKAKDYTLLYNWLMAPFNTKVGYFIEDLDLINEFNYFMLESCRFYLDKESYDSSELQTYFELVKEAGDKLLIDRRKIEVYFREYIDNLFNKKEIAIVPKDISGIVIDLMLSELDVTDMMAHVNLGTQEVDIQSIKDGVRLEKINFVKRLIHDRVLFFVEYYNDYVKKGRYNITN